MIETKTTDNEISMLLNKFGRLDIHENEYPSETFSVGLLDVFDHQLTNQEAIEKIVTYTSTEKVQQKEYLELEKRFLSFFEMVFALNQSGTVYVYCPDFYRQRYKDYRYAVKALKDKEISKLYKKLYRKYQTQRKLALLGKRPTIRDYIFKIQDIDTLQLFAKLSLTECCFSNFFFERTVIIGNYELTLPVYCLDHDLMEELKRKAREVSLYIR